MRNGDFLVNGKAVAGMAIAFFLSGCAVKSCFCADGIKTAFIFPI